MRGKRGKSVRSQSWLMLAEKARSCKREKHSYVRSVASGGSTGAAVRCNQAVPLRRHRRIRSYRHNSTKFRRRQELWRFFSGNRRERLFGYYGCHRCWRAICLLAEPCESIGSAQYAICRSGKWFRDTERSFLSHDWYFGIYVMETGVMVAKDRRIQVPAPGTPKQRSNSLWTLRGHFVAGEQTCAQAQPQIRAIQDPPTQSVLPEKLTWL